MDSITLFFSEIGVVSVLLFSAQQLFFRVCCSKNETEICVIVGWDTEIGLSIPVLFQILHPRPSLDDCQTALTALASATVVASDNAEMTVTSAEWGTGRGRHCDDVHKVCLLVVL